MFPEWYKEYESSRRRMIAILILAVVVVGLGIFGSAIGFAGR